MAEAALEPVGWERALMAAEKVKERLRRATRALDAAGLPYAVAGGNAVAEWVGRIDEGAVRNTPDVDILIRRPDFPATRDCLEGAGFLYCVLPDTDIFVDGPQGKPSAGIHSLYAGEKVRRDDEHRLPEIEESERASEFQVVNFEAILLMKLTSFRLKDRVHLRDMIGIGLLDATWPARLPATLGARLQQLLDDPNG